MVISVFVDNDFITMITMVLKIFLKQYRPEADQEKYERNKSYTANYEDGFLVFIVFSSHAHFIESKRYQACA